MIAENATSRFISGVKVNRDVALLVIIGTRRPLDSITSPRCRGPWRSKVPWGHWPAGTPALLNPTPRLLNAAWPMRAVILPWGCRWRLTDPASTKSI